VTSVAAPAVASPSSLRAQAQEARRVVAVPRAGTPIIARPHPYPRLDRALDLVALVALAVHLGVALAVLWLHFT
jgi:hypothetical protein